MPDSSHSNTKNFTVAKYLISSGNCSWNVDGSGKLGHINSSWEQPRGYGVYPSKKGEDGKHNRSKDRPQRSAKQKCLGRIFIRNFYNSGKEESEKNRMESSRLMPCSDS
jgi:hypothetical protein